jgi:hypothetical protein
MAAKPVTGDGDVSATAGTTPFTGAQGGTWAAGSVQLKTYAKLEAGGKPVVHQAECTFSFSGANASGAKVEGTSTVTLTEPGRPLQKGQQSVLVDGDSANDSFGNKLSVSSTRRLQCRA